MTAFLLAALLAAPTDQFSLLVSTERIAAFHRQLTAHPHRAGTPAGRAQAEQIALLLRGFGLKTEIHSYWAWLPYPRRMSLRLFRGKVESGVALPLGERSDARDPATANPDLPPGFIAYSASGRVRGPIVFVNQGHAEDYNGVSVKDAVVLIRRGTLSLDAAIHEAELHGAAAAVFYHDPAKARAWPAGPDRAAWFVERAALATPSKIPVATIAWSVAEQLRPVRNRPAGELELDVQMNDAPRPLYNVVAQIDGQSSGPALMLGTHHDAWGFGGVDPGGPAAALLETARVLGAMVRGGWHPQRGIRIAFWDAGEYNDAGAAEYTKEFGDAAVRVDVGYYFGEMLQAQGPAELMTVFHTAASKVRGVLVSGSAADYGAHGSNYDTAAYMNRFGDPQFKTGHAVTELLGRFLLESDAAPALPVRLAAPAPVPTPEPDPAIRAEMDHAEARVALAKEAYVAGAITRAELDAATRNLDDAKERYERLRSGSGQLTPAIAAEEVQKAEARIVQLRQAFDKLKTMDEAGIAARRDLDAAAAALREAEAYRDLARTRQQDLEKEWELTRRVKELEAKGGVFDESVLEHLNAAFEKRFGRPLPISALGMTHTHAEMNFDHTGRADVALPPDSPEGAWLIAQLTERDIPFIVFRGAVPGKATGAHIHLGLPSPRLHK